MLTIFHGEKRENWLKQKNQQKLVPHWSRYVNKKLNEPKI
jgi:hypothetical protein